MIELPANLTRSTKVLLVMDVVESVRIMEQDQDGFVRRWQQLVEEAEQNVLPRHGGRIVKSLGDGLMLEFASAQSCVKAAFALHSFARQANLGVPPEHQMHLRMGGHLASFVTDQHDIYGTDVNLTSRVSTLAGPGEMVVSSELRDELAAGLDADVEDLGECHLKHVEKPVRAYRVGPVGHAPVIPASGALPSDLRPTIAVIPFEARSNEPENFVIGELIADGVIAQLSRSPDIRVISRLSTTAFRGRTSVMPDVESRLGASFVLSGSYIASGGKILIMAELADARTTQIVWAERVSGVTDDLLQAQSELLNSLAAATSRALIDAEVQQTLLQPMPRLDSSALLLGGISMMHRSSVRDFDRSRQALDALIERHGRIATPRAWLAKWYIMRIIRGLSQSPEEDARMALEQTKRALDIEPANALTLAVEGHAYCQLLGNFDLAATRLAQSIEANPNEPMAWLFKSVASTMWGAPSDAVSEVEYANALSPIDPLKYYFDMLSAAALLTVNDHGRAIQYARQSLKANRHHAPTMRVLLTAQVEASMLEDAKSTLAMLLAETPGMSVSSYLAIGSASSVTRQRCAVALRALGLTEH
ncbi:MAG: adenylate/guanylate cyclase domain-containing protein [Polaromonas sp.]|uniref:adenylate/guanylate cyclase domain-containing protein n=1 Tax=Polaromonas sp. TaxID=1869339 RepID=UPI0024891768|nr:adenylate/guanylate cyclase domain-containing protein [Polaromonas sp.]MDI1239415.1 adenylate/guanylate cyclase domain-containing protein [Polaromonas sp.]